MLGPFRDGPVRHADLLEPRGRCCSIYVARARPTATTSGADAWEHHRVIVALTRDLWHPGNPTYATRRAIDPLLALFGCAALLICRQHRLDPYDALSGAAVFNTALSCSWACTCCSGSTALPTPPRTSCWSWWGSTASLRATRTPTHWRICPGTRSTLRPWCFPLGC